MNQHDSEITPWNSPEHPAWHVPEHDLTNLDRAIESVAADAHDTYGMDELLAVHQMNPDEVQYFEAKMEYVGTAGDAVVAVDFDQRELEQPQGSRQVTINVYRPFVTAPDGTEVVEREEFRLLRGTSEPAAVGYSIEVGTREDGRFRPISRNDRRFAKDPSSRQQKTSARLAYAFGLAGVPKPEQTPDWTALSEQLASSLDQAKADAQVTSDLEYRHGLQFATAEQVRQLTALLLKSRPR